MKRSFVARAGCTLAAGLVAMLMSGTSAAAADVSARSGGDLITTSATSTQIEMAIAYGQSKVGRSLYTGCWAGAYRMGASPTREMHFDGRNCGQSYIYVLRPGWYGFDCSGLIYRMFQAAGVYFPWTSTAQMLNAGLPQVAKSQIRRGDLLLKSGHVAMYLGRTSDGVPWALEAAPKQILEQDGIWRVAKGVQAVDARPYLNSTAYTVRRV